MILASNHETECLFIYLLKFREVEHYHIRLLLALDRRWVVQFFYWKLLEHVYFQSTEQFGLQLFRTKCFQFLVDLKSEGI